MRAFGPNKMNRGDAERGGVTQDISSRLWPGQAHEQGDRVQSWQRRAPRKAERQGVSADVMEPRFASWPVEEPDVEGVAALPFQHIDDVNGATILAREWALDLERFEKNEVHAGGSWFGDCG